MNLLNILAEFFNIPKVGNTPENKGECTGLVNKYLESLGLPHVWGNAKDLLENADTDVYAITYNDPTDTKQFPVAGSAMVWDETWGNGDGHTGVVIFADGTKFSCLEQNNPDGHAPQTIMHDYKGVKGWFTPKNLPTVPTQSMLDACMTDRDNLWKQRDEALAQVEEVKKELEQTQQKLTSFSALGYSTIDDINKRLDEDTKTIQGLQTEIQQVLVRNGQLADMVKQKEKEDSTAIDTGRSAQLRVVELERQLQIVAKELQTKPLANEILSKFDSLKKLAGWGEKFLKSKEVVAKEVEQKTSNSFWTDFFGIFNLRGGGNDE